MRQIYIVKDKTCFKSLDSPSCIDLIIANKPGCFQKTITTSLGLSDCRMFVRTILKASFKKQDQKKYIIEILNILII